MKEDSVYLLDEYPVMFHSTLACAIGVNEAILLQKINLWLNCKPKGAEGKSWIYNTYKSWQEQLPYFSETTIKRAMKNLRDLGLVETSNFNKVKFDKTLWYTINYDKVDELVQKTRSAKMTLREGQNDLTDSIKMVSRRVSN